LIFRYLSPFAPHCSDNSSSPVPKSDRSIRIASGKIAVVVFFVPDDHLLDMVCQKFGVRYKKELDGSRLATLMNTQEINEEIKMIISEIGSEAV
jgi:hypothetical protein